MNKYLPIWKTNGIRQLNIWFSHSAIFSLQIKIRRTALKRLLFSVLSVFFQHFSGCRTLKKRCYNSIQLKPYVIKYI
ncbi:hypothetical protein BpHYR1_030639 [Brachionus plicatilis]|uniref:Uncharacterized protein n=1 Tax=Brachionus plicatilis TaxID=10195 RepID=A0A3M7RDC6_BRAPC|nr:hypothetical protein BpHYR1_030639 [Brachionus plicatilis]